MHNKKLLDILLKMYAYPVLCEGGVMIDIMGRLNRRKERREGEKKGLN